MVQISLVAARVNAGYSIENIARKMGKSKSTIINWEKGRTSMKVDECEKLCKLYNIPREYIILPSSLQKVE